MKKFRNIVAVALSALMLIALCACSKDKGPDVTGKYICYEESYDNGASFNEPYGESYIELKKGGKGVYNVGLELSFKYTMDGDNFKGTVSFLGMEETMEGTIKDGIMDIRYGETIMHLAKEGVTPVKSTGNGGVSTSASGLNGNYTIYSMTISGQSLTYSDLVEGDMAEGSYVLFYGDGTGMLAFSGDEPESITYDEATGVITDAIGDTFPFSVDGELVTVEFANQDMTITYAPEASDVFSSNNGGTAGSLAEAFGQGGSNSKPDADFVAGYLGDWHGVAEYYDCTGIYEANNGNQCEVLARIVYDEELGELRPFVGMAFEGSNQYNFSISAAHEYDDGEYHYFDIEGLFMEQMLGEESIIEYDGEFNRLYVLATVDDGEGNVMKVVACLRHLDDEWDYENDYPYLEKEGVKYYKGMSFIDIAKLFQLDLDMIPEEGSATAGGSSATQTASGDYGMSNPSATGEATLEDMRALYQRFLEIRTNTYHQINYADVVEALGSDGIPWQDSESTWNDTKHSYKWSNGNGSFLYISFKIDEGEEWYCSCTYSSDVME